MLFKAGHSLPEITYFLLDGRQPGQDFAGLSTVQAVPITLRDELDDRHANCGDRGYQRCGDGPIHAYIL